MLQELVTEPGRYPGDNVVRRKKKYRHLANPRFNVIHWIRISLDCSFPSTLPETSKFQSLGFIYVFCNYKEWLKVLQKSAILNLALLTKSRSQVSQKEAFGAGHVKKGKFINLSFCPGMNDYRWWFQMFFMFTLISKK